jgi:hypothetical protein
VHPVGIKIVHKILSISTSVNISFIAKDLLDGISVSISISFSFRAKDMLDGMLDGTLDGTPA